MAVHRYAVLALVFVQAYLSAALQQRDLSPANNLPDGWYNQGCFRDNTFSRVLGKASYYDDSAMTGQSCVAYCSPFGYAVAGIEYARECHCSLDVDVSYPRVDDGCDFACTGDATQVCGEADCLSIYQNTHANPSAK